MTPQSLVGQEVLHLNCWNLISLLSCTESQASPSCHLVLLQSQPSKLLQREQLLHVVPHEEMRRKENCEERKPDKPFVFSPSTIIATESPHSQPVLAASHFAENIPELNMSAKLGFLSPKFIFL